MLANNPSAAASETFTVTATAMPEDEEMLAAGDYVVVVRDGASPPFGNLSPDTSLEWSEVVRSKICRTWKELFDVGGTIQLKVEGATRLQVVFSEIMWAVDAR